MNISNGFQGRIIVTEYPKSGGTWIVSLLGDCLGLPKKDIYVDDKFKLFDVHKHPWYQNDSDLNLPPICVIKSHELPNSPLINFPAQIIHVARDGRDVIVSKYFYESEFCVKNGIYPSFDISWSDYVKKTASEWNNYILAWLGTDYPWFRYEDLLQDTYSSVVKILHTLHHPIVEDHICAVIKANAPENTRQSLSKAFSHNTFVRKAVAGDWKNHFAPEDLSVFWKIAGDSMRQLGYD
jgi:Sulfotransferase domain